jgi:hypothetical protein
VTNRHDIVEKIVTGAIEGMTPVVIRAQASNDEIMSAYFTLIRRGVQAALMITSNQSATRKSLRDSIFTLLADVTDDTLN